MGIDGRKLEMLFLAPEERGRGLGRKLLEYGITEYGVKELTVNEQNPQAKGFYRQKDFMSIWDSGFGKGQRLTSRGIRTPSCLWNYNSLELIVADKGCDGTFYYFATMV